MQSTPSENWLPQSHLQNLTHTESSYWWYVGRIYWALKLIEESCLEKQFPEGIRYADLGCGAGQFAHALAQALPLAHTTLVDGDPRFLERLRDSKTQTVLKRNFNNALDLPEQYDLISCMDVIEHHKDDAFFLHEIYQHLKVGGQLILSAPAHMSLYSAWDETLGHYRRYSQKMLTEKLQSTGFHVERSSYMWSFCAPLALLRKFQSAVELPTVSSSLNHLLSTLSKAEWHLQKFFSLPFGTSVICRATKK